MSLLARLTHIYDSILSFRAQLPVIGECDNEHPLPGLRLLREEVRRDRDVLDRLLCEPAHPSINAPYLVAVWDELTHASRPVAIYRMFSVVDGQDDTKHKRKIKPSTRAVKVDVVAEDGARWVRVNTIKNSRLMMEFCEMDSGDEDEDGLGPQLAESELNNNSVLRMGRDLLAAAKANPVSLPATFSGSLSGSDSPPYLNNTSTPRVTIRLTRLDPSVPRIEKTIRCLRDMGIDVQLGERPYPPLVSIRSTSSQPKLPEPTTNVSLDLSALIALISDISHSPLPRTEEEAHARFVPPPQSYLEWKKDRAKVLARHGRATDLFLCQIDDTEDDGNTCENTGQQSRALAAQAVQEMNKGVLEEIHERLSAVVGHPSVPSSSVTFWTTKEARQRCLQIVSKIGGLREKQRADALLGSTYCARTPSVPESALRPDGTPDELLEASPGTDDMEGRLFASTYWEHSRYPAGFLPLAPVRLYSSTLPATGSEDQQSRASYFDVLTRTCTGILSQEADPLSQASVPPHPSSTTGETLGEIPPVAHTSLPNLTVHTVRSMLAGASRAHTTLTTNRRSVRAVLKEMRRVYGRDRYTPGMDIEKAALWILDPRSLSERMRSQ